jgi:uncharacterized protein (DUF58 family)
MAVSGFLGKKNIDNTEIKINFPEEIYANIPFYLNISVISKNKFLDSHLLNIEVNGSVSFVDIISANQKITNTQKILFNSRGIHEIKQINIFSSFPFNFFVRSRKVLINAETIVFPEPLENENFNLAKDNEKTDGTSNETDKVAEELSNIKNYEPGDNFRHIHWKHYARTDKLKTKLFTGEISPPIIIDIRIPKTSPETMISFATNEIIKAYNKNIPVGLITNDNFFPPSKTYYHKLMLLRELALYEY